MRHLFAVFFLFSFGVSFGQTITGVVKEKGTGLPLPYANVFVNNTTQGIATDEEGRFTLSGSFPVEIELVTSFVGYVTEVKTISFVGKSQVDVVFELAFNESNLSEIELKAKRDKSWERNFEKFKEVFLAVSDDPYLTQIEILNPWVVDFEKIRVKKGANYLQASAQEPLKIINTALGYKIEYYLEDFRLLRSGSRFFGQVFYEPMTALDTAENNSWEDARQANYFGSLRHLNQSILLNTPDSSYFALFLTKPTALDRNRTNDFLEELNETIIPIRKDSILRRPLGDGTFRIFLPERVEVHHLGKEWLNEYYAAIYHPISWLQAPEGFYDVDRNGALLNPTQLVLAGYLGRKRVARTLPLDFNPSSEFENTETLAEMVTTSPELKLSRLREKVWLTSSKPYFYPGETAWIGGRVLYQEAFLADSLSRVVHVDIVGENRQILQSITLPIQQGKISGAFELPSSMSPGDYVLRAYTHWNRNFPDEDQFIAPFVVLETGYVPEPVAEPKESFPRDINVKAEFEMSDSVNYRVMDLQLTFLDEFENSIDGEFVLSVSDVDQVEELTQESSLEEAMSWLDEGLLESFESSLTYPIEYGISLQGTYTPDNRRQPLITPVTIVRGDLEDYGQVMPDSAGNFWATGLSYQDTAQIAISAVDEKLRPFGSVELIPFDKPDFEANFPKLGYKRKLEPSEEYFLDLSGDYILMEEFVKEEAKVRETMADRNYGYGMPDREVNEEQLFTLPPNVINARLGLKGSTIGNFNFGQSTGVPLLVIDGTQYPFLSSDDFFNILDSYTYPELKSIKVYTYSAPVFGMAGYAGVIMIETRNGSRTASEIETQFNSEGFDFFSVPGFTDFPEFPKSPPSDRYLTKKPTIYWDPLAETQDGVYQVQVKVPYGINRFRIKVEGRSLDGEVIYQVIEVGDRFIP